MKVLGIDPGYERMGVAIVERDQNTHKETLLFSDCYRTSSSEDFATRLHSITSAVYKLIQTYQVDNFAIEKLYFTSNQKTAMYVSQIIGALLFVAGENNLQIYEYTPLQIKSAITGNGRANKQSVMAMLHHLIKIEKRIKLDDEYDAIAIALTHLAYNR